MQVDSWDELPARTSRADQPLSYAGRHAFLIGSTIPAILWHRIARTASMRPRTALQRAPPWLTGVVVAGMPRPPLIKATLGNRGLVHHPLLGLAPAATGIAATWWYRTPLPTFAALGWNVDLLGDAQTRPGRPGWGDGRMWIAPAPFRFWTGRVWEDMAVTGWLLAGAALIGLTWSVRAGEAPLVLGA